MAGGEAISKTCIFLVRLDPLPHPFFFLIPLLQVFVDSKPYSVKPLEELLLQEFGADTKLFDIREPK